MIRLRGGPYMGHTGTVVSVHPDKNYSAENSLVLVKLLNGRINSCYMANLEMLQQAAQPKAAQADETSGLK